MVTELDETPGPIEMARLSEGMYAGRPEKYINVETYDPGAFDLAGVELSDVGLQLHLPEPTFTDDLWPEQVEPLFTLELGFQAELDAGVLSSSLQALFADQALSIPPGTAVHGCWRPPDDNSASGPRGSPGWMSARPWHVQNTRSANPSWRRDRLVSDPRRPVRDWARSRIRTGSNP